MEKSEIQYLEIDRLAFESLNDEDGWGIFAEERDNIYLKLSLSEQSDFDHDLFNKEQIVKLYKAYDKLVVGSDDSLYGYKGNKKEKINMPNNEGLYEYALTIIDVL
jgi:hypothetical protein